MPIAEAIKEENSIFREVQQSHTTEIDQKTVQKYY